MLALLADSDVLFVIRLCFGTGYVTHSVFFTCNLWVCLKQLKLFLVMYTQYIGICQRILTICCAFLTEIAGFYMIEKLDPLV